MTVAKKKNAPKKKAAPKTRAARAQINAPALIAALESHVLGVQEMSATQVSAALALLKKTMPDVSETRSAATPAGLTHEEALAQLE